MLAFDCVEMLSRGGQCQTVNFNLRALRSPSQPTSRAIVALTITLAFCCLRPGYGQAPSIHAPRMTTPGTSDKVARQEASQAMPYDRIRPEIAKRIHSVVSQPTVFRRLPVSTIESDPDLFVFLVRNPEIVIGIWKVMGVTSIDLKRTGQFHFNAHDGMGTASEVDLVYGTPNMHLYFGQGLYEGSLFKAKVFGQCVMLLRSVTQTTANGQTTMRNVLDVFIKLDSPAIDLVARTFQPLFIKSADVNFTETSKFLEKLSKTAELNPSGVADLAMKLPEVSPPVRNRFIELSRNVGRLSSELPIEQMSRSRIPTKQNPQVPTYVSQVQGVQTSRREQPDRFLR